MKKNTIIWLLLLSPLLGLSQKISESGYDKFLKKHRVATEALPVEGLTGNNRLALAFSAIGENLFLTISGTGWGTATIDKADELRLRFSNDSVITLASTSLQGFEPGAAGNAYRHQYALAPAQLEAFAKASLAGLRKQSFSAFSDLSLPPQNATRLAALGALFLSEIKRAGLYRPFRQITLRQIPGHIGDSVQFCGKVYKTRYFQESAGGPTLLDVQADFSDPFVNVVILQKDRDQFGGAPEKKYIGREVCISGVLSLRNNLPYLELRHRGQLTVKSPVDLAEIGLFVGDSVTTTGTVFSGSFLEDGQTKPTLLNMGAPYPGQPLTLVIAAADRPSFGKPEALYVEKVVKVAGRVEAFNGRPQMVLRQPGQVVIVGAASPVAPAPTAGNTGQRGAGPVMELPPVTVAPPAKKNAVVPAATAAGFPGGDTAFRLFIKRNFVIPDGIPLTERKEVTLSFEVDVRGIWRNMRLLTSAGKELDRELVKVLKRMPKWLPATREGKAVSSQVTYPVVLIEPVVRKRPATLPAF